MRLLIISLLILRVDIEKDKCSIYTVSQHNAQLNENIRLQIKKTKNEKLVAFQLGNFAPFLYIVLDIFCGTFSALTASP